MQNLDEMFCMQSGKVSSMECRGQELLTQSAEVSSM